MSKIRASCLIRGSKYLERIKALGLRSLALIRYSVFGTPDQTISLVLIYYFIRVHIYCLVYYVLIRMIVISLLRCSVTPTGYTMLPPVRYS